MAIDDRQQVDNGHGRYRGHTLPQIAQYACLIGSILSGPVLSGPALSGPAIVS